MQGGVSCSHVNLHVRIKGLHHMYIWATRKEGDMQILEQTIALYNYICIYVGVADCKTVIMYNYKAIEGLIVLIIINVYLHTTIKEGS